MAIMTSTPQRLRIAQDMFTPALFVGGEVRFYDALPLSTLAAQGPIIMRFPITAVAVVSAAPNVSIRLSIPAPATAEIASHAQSFAILSAAGALMCVGWAGRTGGNLDGLEMDDNAFFVGNTAEFENGVLIIQARAI